MAAPSPAPLPAPEASSSVDLTTDYSDDSVTIDFALQFNAAKCAAWWLVWLVALAYAFVRRGTVSRAWFIYTMLLATICFNGIQTSAYVGYASHVKQGHSGSIGYIIYIFFFNVARSSFLAVLLVVASGYCITRSDLGPHKQHVIFVPVTVLVTGLITDYSFFALQSSPDANTYDLSSMGALAATVWFVCSVLNLAALILAWMYIFEALGKETRTLEEEYKRRTGKLEAERHAEAAAEVRAAAVMAGHPGYAALGSGPTAAAAAPSAPPPPADVEAGGDGETVAEHLQYNAKMKLMSRFGKGVAAYLISDVCVLLLPAFFNHVVQSTLQALLFVCYLVFVVVLLVLFRPQEQSSYLMVGFSEEDAEDRGVTQLATGIAMAELGPGGHGSGDEETARLGGGTSGPSAAAGTSGGGSAAAARAAARSARTAARAAKKAGADGDRYRALPASSSASAAGTATDGGGNGVGSLPVSTMTADSASYGNGAMPPPASYRGRQPRTFVPQPPAQGPRQFTLGDDEDEDDDASRPLTGPGLAGKGR